MTWSTKKLGEIARIFAGSSAPQASKYFKNGKYPFVRVSDLNGGEIKNIIKTRDYVNDLAVKELRLIKAKKNSIVFPKSGAAILTNSRAILGIDAYIVSHLAVVETNLSYVSPDYLFLFLSNFDMRNLINDPAYPSLKLSDIKEIEIPLPPLSEQKRIVEKIEKLFAKIDEAERLRAESLATSATLLPSALHQVFSRAKKENWPTKKLREIAILNPKKQEVNSLSDNLLVSFVPMSAVDEITQTIKEYEFRRLSSVKKGYTYFKEGDILFAKITPCMENGKVAIAKNLKNGIGFGSTEFHVLRPRDKVLAEWIFYIVGSHAFREEAERHMTGTAGQQRVPIGFLEDAKIPLPPLSEQKKIVAYLDALSQKSRELQKLQQQTAADFSALRQSVLAQAFNQNS